METFATDSPGDCQTTTTTTTTTESSSSPALIAVTETKKNPKIKTRKTERASRQKRALSLGSLNTHVGAQGSGSGHSINATTTSVTTATAAIAAVTKKTTTTSESSASVADPIPLTRRTRSSKMCLSPSPTNNHHQNVNNNNNNISNNGNSNNNSNNKLKSQQQQQPILPAVPATTIKFHHFRAPQHFVKHKRATSMLAKKNKAWNKRQNKCHLHKQQKHHSQQQHHRNHHQHNLNQQQQQHQQDNTCKNLSVSGVDNGACSGGGGNSGASNNGLGSLAVVIGSGVAGVLPPLKADLENIQNVKNQLGSGGGGGAGHHHHQYYQTHHHQHHQHHQQHGGHHGGSRGGGGGNCIAACLCSLGKLGYGHGHLKQQIYKKMLVHRGHHHHVLGSGAAHNTSGSVKSICCLANGCTVQNGKDSVSLNSLNTTSHPNLSHYCCGRSKFFLPEKRPRKEVIIPPTKFLLGGTISDPLNLNSLQNESASNTSSNNNTPTTTPRQSPITTPPKVEVIIPPNIHDPLHLLDPVDSMEYEKQLTSPLKRRIKSSTKKHRHRKNRKPKRRRYESYASSITLEDGGTSGSASAPHNNSLLTNSSLNTESMNVNTSSTMLSNISNSLSSTNTSSGVGACSGISKSDDGHNASALLHTDTDVLLSSANNDSLEKSATILSPICSQQHVAGSVGEPFVEAENKSPALRVQRSCEKERASKDLRLELNTNGGHGGTSSHNTNNNNYNNINNSAASSTCGSITTIGCIGFGGGRKRKISESSNSQKNKKHHRIDSMDKIVSPVVPQPGAWKRPPRTLPSGARKTAARRSTSMSENELLSPAEENQKTIIDSASNRGDTPDFNKVDSISEACFGSPLSTASGATSVAVGEQDSMLDVSIKEDTSKADEGCEDQTASNTISRTSASSNTKLPPKFRPEGAKYQYGNYDRYGGLRNLNEFMDVRLHVFQRHLELFKDKDILDIGCNVGHMTITVACNLSPKSILGIDIDKDLIARARRNLSMYVRIPPKASVKEEMKTSEEQKPEVSGMKLKKTRRQWKKNKQRQLAAAQEQQRLHNAAIRAHHHHPHHPHHPHQYHHLLYHHHHHHQVLLNTFQHTGSTEFFPISFPINFGGIPPDDPINTATPTNSSTPGHGGCSTSNGGGDSGSQVKSNFPQNVYFRRANYVLKDEAQLNDDTQQYDLIMCLSVTKWIHLNFGDNGLKLAFKRMFNQLRPGGKLILEAQNWASYKKRKNLTEQIYNNYRNIEFFPNKFHEYLLSSEVGFSHSYTLGVPRHLNKGFCRPIQLYAKGDYTPNHVRWSDAYYPQTPYEAYRGIYATLPPRPHPLISSSRSQNYDTPHHPGIGSASGGAGGVGGPGSSSSYSCRQTPMHQLTSQYYNPLETDSYLPSYDMEYLNHLYVFASPLYQTIWSPPTSLRNSSTHTPLFGSIREAELDGDVGSGSGAFGGSYHRHVYLPNDDTSSPNANVGGAFNSIRDPDTDDSSQLPTNSLKHVYAANCESSSSPNGLHAHESSEPIDESLILADANDEVGLNGPNCCSDLKEA